MERIILVDHQERDHLLPLTFTRPVAKIRVGAFTIAEKWEKRFGFQVSFLTQDYLQQVFPADYDRSTVAINGALVPTASIVEEISLLKDGQSLYNEEHWLATRTQNFNDLGKTRGDKDEQSKSQVVLIDRNWKIFQWNEWAINEDFKWISSNLIRSTTSLDGVTLIGDNLFVEEGAIVQPSAVINSETGPVYIAKGSEVMEGSIIRGALALMESSVLKLGAKIYGATTIGPHSKVGGEVNNAVIFGYSNKGHDGFIGNTVIGEWCNLGADTNTSNLKNNYADVKIYNYALKRSETTGGQFCGLTMGDHAKSGINTMFNTGSVCGVFANVFGAGFPHRNIPDFGWGGADGFRTFRIADALDVAEKVMIRRGIELNDDWRKVYTHLFENLTKSKN
jgi:UDP-N-acetylglucosamine diphosphorylase/glucosamine-1-phosphate N-acetyltransferase